MEAIYPSKGESAMPQVGRTAMALFNYPEKIASHQRLVSKQGIPVELFVVPNL